MTTDPAAEPANEPMIRAFPEGGALIRLAYRELNIATNGTKEQKNAIGDPRLLPQPWDPPTCRNTELREQVWAWLEDVVTWLNREYVWDVGAVIPGCWPQHPHLVHEIAVLADQRRRAGTALTSQTYSRLSQVTTSSSQAQTCSRSSVLRQVAGSHGRGRRCGLPIAFFCSLVPLAAMLSSR